MKEVVILGAGFTGQTIVDKLHADQLFHITLIDKHNYISYKPLFPDVATGRLPSDVIEYSLKEYAHRKNIDYIAGTVTAIDTKSCEINIDQRTIRYDYLVVATGVETSFYGSDQFRPYVYTIDSLEECKRLQQDLEQIYSSGSKKLTINIIGGGYTGIETATHLRKVLLHHNIQPDITIIEAQDQILKMMPEWIRKKTVEHLNNLQIRIETNIRVTNLSDEGVYLKERLLPADIVIWSAGMQGTKVSSFFSSVARNKRIDVDAYLHPDGLKNVFIAGDASSLYRMAVPIAKQYGQYVASSFIRLEKGVEQKPFKAKDYGYVIALANHRGIGKLGIIPVDGLFGYLFHYFMCALTLLGCKNKQKLFSTILSRMVSKS